MMISSDEFDPKSGMAHRSHVHRILTRAVPVDLGPSPVSNAIRFSSSEQLFGEALKLWVLHAADVDIVGPELSVLDDDEFRHAAMIESPRQRRSYILAHIALRQFLAQYLDVPPAQVVYFREPCPRCDAPHGRPAVFRPPHPLHFSLSVSASIVLIGIASAPVGVDVEVLPGQQTIGQVSMLLHPAERAEVRAADPSKQPMVFTRLWTRKEAYLKGVGVGVAHGLATEYLGTEGRAAVPHAWSVLDVPVPSPYAAAAAVRTGPVPPVR
jgi:4'-phosphopantetheinyl transferase